MKLVDILARELKVWPCLGRKLFQGHKGHIYPTDGDDTYAVMDRAEDWDLAEVTRDEWQAAVDALQSIEPIHDPEWHAAFDALNVLENGVPEWNGEGLPPVGTVCEAKTTRGWSRGTIIAHGLPPKENIAVWQEGGERISLGVKEYFRQIRTPEQIAAEERDKAIEGMIADTNILTGIMSDRRIMAGQLYDAGYRKFKIVDN